MNFICNLRCEMVEAVIATMSCGAKYLNKLLQDHAITSSNLCAKFTIGCVESIMSIERNYILWDKSICSIPLVRYYALCLNHT